MDLSEAGSMKLVSNLHVRMHRKIVCICKLILCLVKLYFVLVCGLERAFMSPQKLHTNHIRHLHILLLTGSEFRVNWLAAAEHSEQE